MSVFADAMGVIDACEPIRRSGVVASIRGLCAIVRELPAPVGAMVALSPRSGAPGIPAEVIGFDGADLIVMALASAEGLGSGDRATLERASPLASVGGTQLGRVLDGLGRAIDGGPSVGALSRRAVDAPPLSAMRRRLIREPLATGVRAVDLLTPLGKGQRMGVFAGPGVGKSTLLAQLARGAASDVNVIALIGERGREVREFVEEALGADGLARSVVIASTGDESPVMRVRAAKSACAIAEHFRDRGLDVLLIMDSATRFAHAQRQIGLAAGEPPATRGYPPSVFSELARLLERAGAVESDEATKRRSDEGEHGRRGLRRRCDEGHADGEREREDIEGPTEREGVVRPECRMPNADRRVPNPECRIPNAECPVPNPDCRSPEDAPRSGSITGLYTVLVEGDDMTEPVADAARGILDGHLILSRTLAQRGQYPAIDPLDSVSRVAEQIGAPEHLEARRTIIRLLGRHAEIEELVRIGAYARGSDPEADVALDFLPDIRALLGQDRSVSAPADQTRAGAIELAARASRALHEKGVAGAPPDSSGGTGVRADQSGGTGVPPVRNESDPAGRPGSPADDKTSGPTRRDEL